MMNKVGAQTEKNRLFVAVCEAVVKLESFAYESCRLRDLRMRHLPLSGGNICYNACHPHGSLCLLDGSSLSVVEMRLRKCRRKSFYDSLSG